MTAVLKANWNYPTKIWSGPGRIAELLAACNELGMYHPLIVTDAGLKDHAMIKRAQELLGGATVFAEVKGNPISANVERGLQVYRDGKHDGVVAFGGGSALDAGKVIAFMSGQTRPLWDFEDVGDWWLRANVDGMAPVVAIPTTAGTGSEVGRASVIINEATRQKKIIFHPRMMPGIVIADPELTVGLPPWITAATGIDAFVHCFEAWCAPGFHPLADGIALEGMRLIKQYLPIAYADGANLEARSRMLAAASMGATAFQKGLGAVHAIAHPVGSFYDTHHGLTNAILLPYVMQYNREAIADRMAPIAELLELRGGGNSSTGKSGGGPAGYDTLFDWVLQFRQRLNIPHSLAEIKVPLEDSEKIGHEASIDPSAGSNPVQLDAATYARVFRSAVKGDLKLGG